MYPYINFLGLNIPSYGLCMSMAIILCAILCINKSRKFGLKFEDMIIISATSVGTALLSGGILYIIVSYSFEEIYNYIKRGNFSFITNGGLVFYGGLIGGILGALISGKILKINIDILEKSIVSYIPLGHAIGRIGCLLAGCCHGFEYDGIFAVKNILNSAEKAYFPIQAVEAVLNVFIMVILLLHTKKERLKYNILYLYLMMYSIVRFSLEFFRGDEIRGGFLSLSTSQWISIFIFLFCVVWKKFFNKKTIKTQET